MYSPERRRSWLLHHLSAKIAALPMIFVATVVFAGFSIWTVVHSFTGSRLLPNTDFVGLAQYERLWSSDRWIASVKNIMIYGSMALVLTIALGFLLAVLLDQKIRFEDTFRTILLYPFALSFIVTGLVWQWILNPEMGLQNSVRGLSWTGFSFDPLNDADQVLYGMLFAGLWQGTGLIMCIMLAGLRGIDESIWKAASIDGIPRWKTYVFIIIPMMRGVFATALVLVSASVVKIYDLVVAMTSGGPGTASEMPAKYVYDAMFLNQNLGQGFAASTRMLVSVAIIIVPYFYLQYGGNKRG
ncbi:MAG: carbohydrate ABC transporter permease [Paracoccus sp. (in: a-proteobacteria)]|uniref:carbohydrate ABC transporter permease n=1 Tax=Paracoccus sp. TaxID=267 RepID=UPI00391B3D2D